MPGPAAGRGAPAGSRPRSRASASAADSRPARAASSSARTARATATGRRGAGTGERPPARRGPAGTCAAGRWRRARWSRSAAGAGSTPQAASSWWAQPVRSRVMAASRWRQSISEAPAPSASERAPSRMAREVASGSRGLPAITARILSSSMRFSRSRISARLGTVKKARSWWALVSGWFTLCAMSSASLRTWSNSIDSMTVGMCPGGSDIGRKRSIFRPNCDAAGFWWRRRKLRGAPRLTRCHRPGQELGRSLQILGREAQRRGSGFGRCRGSGRGTSTGGRCRSPREMRHEGEQVRTVRSGTGGGGRCRLAAGRRNEG